MAYTDRHPPKEIGRARPIFKFRAILALSIHFKNTSVNLMVNDSIYAA